MSYRSWKKQAERMRAEKDMLEKQLVALTADIEQRNHIAENSKKAKWVVSEVVRLTQENVKEYIEELVTMALVAVFDRDYKFVVDFDMRDNRSNCLLRVQEGDWEPYVPKDDQGGGILDVISFALRVVLWSLENPPSNNFFYLDEPMKFVGSGDSAEIERAVGMMKEVSDKLGIQLIINTHEPMVASIGDRVFRVTHKNGKSQVTSGRQSKLGIIKEIGENHGSRKKQRRLEKQKT